MRICAFILFLLAAKVSTMANDAAFFNDKVLPVFEARCFECHSHGSKIKSGLALDSREGWVTGGERGPAIVPGDPGKSLLLKAIRRADPDLKMPPKFTLPDDEVAIIESWIKSGAIDPREPKAGATKDTNWWSLRALVQPARPGKGHPVDAFRKTKTEDADRRTLLRRLTYDLHGLLPTPDEVEAFAKDENPRAYENAVDRLLASPRYGERSARQWLDIIHFADTHGFEHDLIRSNAWRFRDYVVDSFNRDTPWPRFIKEQLAADVFYPD